MDVLVFVARGESCGLAGTPGSISMNGNIVRASIGVGWVAFSLCVTACGADPGGPMPSDSHAAVGEPRAVGKGPQATDAPGKVGVTTQALANWHTIYTGDGETLDDIGSTFGFTVSWFNGCAASGKLIDLASSTYLEVPFLPPPPLSCLSVTAAATDTNTVFVAEIANNQILSPQYIPPATFVWSKVADTIGNPGYGMAVNSSYVFWADYAGVRRSPKAFNSTATTILTGAGVYDVLGLEGSYVYISRQDSDGTYSLLRGTIAGGVALTLKTGLLNIRGFGYDANNFYFCEDDKVRNIGRIRQLSKSNSALTTLAQAPLSGAGGKNYFVPRQYNSMMYWVEYRYDTDDVVIRRRNLTNGNVVTKPYAAYHLPFIMNVNSGGIVAGGFSGDQGYALITHGDL